MLLSQPIISLNIGLLKQFIWKTWNYQYEMDFQSLKMRNKIEKNFHINFLKSSFLALEIFQCILLLNFWFDDTLYFYFYFDIIMSYVLNPHVNYICMIKKNNVIILSSHYDSTFFKKNHPYFPIYILLKT